MSEQPNLVQTIQEVSEKASLLVREEIELAKAEVTQKVTKLGKGAAIAAAAGVFVLGALVMILFGLAYFAYWLIPYPDGHRDLGCNALPRCIEGDTIGAGIDDEQVEADRRDSAMFTRQMTVFVGERPIAGSGVAADLHLAAIVLAPVDIAARQVTDP